MSDWTADTLSMLTDGIGEGPTVFTIRSISEVYAAGNPIPHRTSTIADTATGMALRVRNRFIRDRRGETISIDWEIHFMPTADVAVGRRLSRSGETDFAEIVSVLRFEDHLEVLAVEIEGR